MKYTGKLYGKVGRKYVTLVMTSEDVSQLQSERDGMLNALVSIAHLYGPNGNFAMNATDVWNRVHAVIRNAKKGTT